MCSINNNDNFIIHLNNNHNNMNQQNNNNNNNKLSDFSIDHILNYAGDNFKTNKDNNYHINSNSADVINNLPTLDWLLYTRYHPPKLPKANRIGPIKRQPGRLPRVPFTTLQLNLLEDAYKASNYLSSEQATKLAEKLDLTSTRVKIWFQNRRARERRERNEHDKSPKPN